MSEEVSLFGSRRALSAQDGGLSPLWLFVDFLLQLAKIGGKMVGAGGGLFLLESLWHWVLRLFSVSLWNSYCSLASAK